MSRPRVEGVCNICGHLRKLSYEHVPPHSAFNDRKVILSTADQYWNHGRKGGRIKGVHLQAGHGVYTLCERCNNTTGGWYGASFADWCKEGFEFHDRTGGKATIIETHFIRPLPVIKQVVTMFLAMHGGEGLRDRHPDLVRFVLNRDANHLHPRYRFWVYYVAPGPLRKTPPCAILNIETGRITSGMEFSFPPYGYMITIDSTPQDDRLFEVSRFARYQFLDLERVVLNLRELPTHGPVLGDYRQFEDIERKDGDTNVILDQDFRRWTG